MKDNFRDNHSFIEFVATAQNICKLPPDAKLLLGVSGGIDSMVMATLFRIWGREFSIAHINFSLRGTDSDEDELFVQQWCKNNQVKFYSKKVDTIAYSNERSISIEMAAREIRYNYFVEIAKKNGIDFVAVAHSASDNIETLILNLSRGTGLKGLSGISTNTICGIKIIRPLIHLYRNDIEKIAHELDVKFRIDKTNFDTSIKRNFIRHTIIPQLKKINPSIEETLSSNINNFTQANKFVDFELEKYRELFDVTEEDIKHNNLLQLKNKYLQSCLDIFNDDKIAKLLQADTYEFVLYNLLSPYGASLSTINSIVNCSKDVGKFFLTPSHLLVVNSSKLYIYKGSLNSFSPENIIIGGDGDYNFGDFHFSIRGMPKEFTAQMAIDSIKQYQRKTQSSLTPVLFLDEDSFSYPLICRSYKKGEKFSPLGLKGSKLIADFFAERGIDNLFKSHFPLFQTEKTEEIIAIAGVEVSDKCKITSNTKSLVKIEIYQ